MTPENVVVKVDLDHFAVSKAGAVVGRIHFVIGGRSFPEEAWSDFPVVILGWWLRELSGVLKGTSLKATCRFMDGPMKVEITQDPHSDYGRLKTYEQDRAEDSLGIDVVTGDLFQEVLKCARLVAQHCSQKGWQSRDLTELALLIH